MRNPIVRILVFLTGCFLTTPLFAAIEDSRVFQYTVGDATPEIRCSLLRHCTITFPPEVTLHDYIISDPARWIVNAGVAGPEDERTYWIVTRPRYCGITTLLTVPSELGLAHVVLKSPECPVEEALGPGDEVRVLAPRVHAPLSIEPPPMPEPEPEPEPVLEPAAPRFEEVTFARRHRRLSRSGILVYHDGERTYVQLPESVRKLPTIAHRGKRGKAEVPLNFRWNGKVLILDEVVERGFLLFGKDRIRFGFPS